MKMIIKSKKAILSATMVLVMVLSCVFTGTPSAEAATLKYNTEWGKLYRTPNRQNSYGRCWYGTNGPIQKYYICMDSYYTQGSSASLTYYYYKNKKAKDNKKKTPIKRSSSSYNGDSSATYKETASVLKGTYINTYFYAAARGFSLSITKK